MKKVLIVTVAGLCAAAAAYGALGDVVGSYAIPGGANAGLGIGTYLYVDNYSSSRITVANPLTGSEIATFASAGGSNNRGLAYADPGGYLWQCKAYTSPFLLYRTNAANGSIYASFNTSTSTCHGCAPLASGDGGSGTSAIFVSDYNADMIYVYNTSGSLTSSFSVDSATMFYDIAYDWRNQIIWGGMNGSTIWGVDTSGSLVRSFSGPWSGAYGMAYSGEYLYLAYISGYLYRVHCPGNLNVVPTSVGKIKTLYR